MTNPEIETVNLVYDKLKENKKPIVLIQNKYAEDLLDELFKEIEHGDEQHRRWLKEKIDNFKQRKLYAN